MKKVLLFALAAVLTIGAASKSSAQKFELGARVGIGSEDFKIGVLDIAKKNKFSWNAAVVSRVRIVGFGIAGLYVQPEVVYSESNLNVKEAAGSDISKVKMQTVDVPLLLSLKVSILRVQAGPTFSVMNNFNTTDGALKLEDPTRNPVGFAAGVSIDLGPLVIDGRYHGDFKDMSFKGDWGEQKSRFSSWSAGVGLMF